MADKKYEVIIAGRKYTIVSEEGAEEQEFIDRVASVVDSLIVESRRRNPLLSKEDSAILVAVNAVADRTRLKDPKSVSAENDTLREELSELRNKYENLEKEFNESKEKARNAVNNEKSIIELQDSLKNSSDLNIDLRGEIEEKDRKLAETLENKKELEERLLESETQLLFAEKELRKGKN